MIIKQELQREIKKIHKEFKPTIIHVTRDIEEAIFLADKIAIMKDGQLSEVLKVKSLGEELNKSYISNYFK